jgi:hypothetical protein
MVVSVKRRFYRKATYVQQVHASGYVATKVIAKGSKIFKLYALRQGTTRERPARNFSARALEDGLQ